MIKTGGAAKYECALFEYSNSRSTTKNVIDMIKNSELRFMLLLDLNRTKEAVSKIIEINRR